MKTRMLMLVCSGALCAVASASGQSSRVREFFKFEEQPVAGEVVVLDPFVVNSSNASGPEDKEDALIRRLARYERAARDLSDDGYRLGRRVSLVTDDDPPSLSGLAEPRDVRADLLPASLLKKYKGGFSVRLPFSGQSATMYIRSGIGWDVGRHKRLIFPYVSRYVGFKYKMSF